MPRKVASQRRKIVSNRKWLWFFAKLFVVFVVIFIAYGVWLDHKIRSRLDGQVWQLPAAVYGRMVNLEPDTPISQTEVVKLLEATQYRQVARIVRPGEFTMRGHNIELMRRPFDFPDGTQGAVRVQLVFSGGQLVSIVNMENHRQFAVLRLDPRLITLMSSANSEQRLFVPLSGIPSLLQETLIVTEDRKFYHHDGISLYSIGRAVLANLTAGRTVQGASTLTQQLAKNLFLSSERTLWRKANEAYMALIIDARYSKQRILELYLNEVYLGQDGNDQIRGFPLASLYYFGRPVDELSLDQQAMLVGMAKGASLYNPWRNPEKTLQRRNVVLKLLEQHHIIDHELYETLSERSLGVLAHSGVNRPQPAFMQMVNQELHDKLGDKVQDLSGVKIFTTFDPLAQEAAETAVLESVPLLKKQRKLPDLETAMVVVDRFTGEVRAMIGGANPQFAGYNRAMQARRSIGSLAKPATYLTALGQPRHYRMNTLLSNAPLSLRLASGKSWSPQNDNRQFSAPVMLADALAYSVNVPTVNLGMTLGLPAVVDTWDKLGVKVDVVNQVPAILLGALNLTPLEVAQAFQTIASGGNRARLSALRSVIRADGQVLYQSLPQAEREIAPEAAYLTLWGMQQVVKYGTAHVLGKQFSQLQLAGKTGTTNNQIDSWFTGIDGSEVAVTWVGRDSNKPTKLYGSSGAMAIYQRYLASRSSVPLVLTPPSDIADIAIDGAGNFVCSGGAREIPVWTRDAGALCQQPAQVPVSEQPAPQAPQQNHDGVADWIKQMFGSNE